MAARSPQEAEERARRIVTNRFDRKLARKLGAPKDSHYGWILLGAVTWTDIYAGRLDAYAYCTLVHRGWAVKAFAGIDRTSSDIAQIFGRTLIEIHKFEPTSEDSAFHRLIKRLHIR